MSIINYLEAMMHIVIDLMGDEDVIDTKPVEEDVQTIIHREELKKKFLEDLFKRAPRLQIIPISTK